MKFIPHDYQKRAIQLILDKPKVGLFLDMGLGKTVCTLTAIDELIYERFEVNKVLVIAPKRVAEDTWTTEAAKWDHTKHLRISSILGSKNDRIKALDTDADIYVINRENVKWLVYTCKPWMFDMVVIDELSSFKSNRSQRFKSLKSVTPYFDRCVGLTGTPTPNGLLDLWPQMYLLDRGERLGRTVTAYRDKYFYPAACNGHIVYKYGLKTGADDQIMTAISDICISMKAEDYLNMPEKIVNIVKVKMDKKARKLYDTLEKDCVMTIEETDVTALNAASLTGKLLQMANGCVYDENGGTVLIHDEKLDALEEIIEAAQGEPVLVFYNFKHDFERIKSRFKHVKTLDGSSDIREWNEGKISLLACHPASVGHGLNIQRGGHIIVWFGLTWSLELYQQANARLYRQGQDKSVIIHHIVTEDTVDEDVMKALTSKEINQNVLLEAVKDRIMSVKKK